MNYSLFQKKPILLVVAILGVVSLVLYFYDSLQPLEQKTSSSTPSTEDVVRTNKQEGVGVIAQMSTDIHITDTVLFNTVDTNGDGIYDALIADVNVEVLTEGFYTVSGVLKKDGETVSNQPAYEHQQSTQVIIGDQLGMHTATLRFSGEEIFRSKENGPYELMVSTLSNETVEKKTVATPAYDYTDFGEREHSFWERWPL